jgi:hypothetical protein
MSEYQDNLPAVVGTVDNPFARGAVPAHVNAGTVAIESERAVAEAQGKMVLAKRFPRDTAMAAARAIDACKRPSLAEAGLYRYSRGGGNVEGPSIRLAEELARCWGNIEYGLRELSRKEGYSEMEAFAWDLETNVRSVQNFTVRHIRDKKGGGQALHEERDIYEITANMGSRRVRARILAILPPDLTDAAVAQVRKTLRDGSELPLADRINSMVRFLSGHGVTTAMLVAYLGHPIDQTTPDELVDLKGIATSLKDGQSKAADHFGPKADAVVDAAKPGKLDALEQAVKQPAPATFAIKSPRGQIEHPTIAAWEAAWMDIIKGEPAANLKKAREMNGALMAEYAADHREAVMRVQDALDAKTKGEAA